LLEGGASLAVLFDLPDFAKLSVRIVPAIEPIIDQVIQIRLILFTKRIVGCDLFLYHRHDMGIEWKMDHTMFLLKVPLVPPHCIIRVVT
jgi:hypothetical protein